jgi:putative transposase
MPSKLVQRNFVENRVYHIANHGLESRPIFRKKEDYEVMLSYMHTYLRPLKDVLQDIPTLPKRLHSKNLASEVDLLSYCLLPNHFHFLIHQRTRDGISKFMKQLTNAYTLYFNQKYHRSGSLFQGRYKATQIIDEGTIPKVARFIHLHPYNSKLATYLNRYPYSSYMEYIGESALPFCKIDTVASFFTSKKLLQKYILDLEDYQKELDAIRPFSLDKFM